MKRFITILLLFLPLLVHAQRTIRGQILNGETNEPLPFSTIFLANTTKGTTADEHGKFILSNVQIGRYDMVVSFVGFETFAFPIQTDSLRSYQIRLKPMANQLGEVRVRAKRDPDWDEHLLFFTKNFIGTSKNAQECKILNPNVLWFDDNRDEMVLKAGSNEPLDIENKALGYRVKYLLDTFVYDYKQQYFSYQGYPVLEEMTARSPRQQKRWDENRRRAYLGSPMHFMRAVHERCVAEEGFILRRIIEKSDSKTPGKRLNNKKDRYLIKDPLAPDYLVVADSSTTKATMIKFTDLVQVTYTHEHEEPEYLRLQSPFAKTMARGGPQTSIMHMLAPHILIEPNGNYYEPLGVLFEGYWSWEKMAELLPLNYKP